MRQRHYLRTRDGQIERHWAYSAPPRTLPPGARDNGGLLLDERLVASLGRWSSTSP